MNNAKDESGDRKNFTIIPNYILVRCNPWQLSLWLTIKSIAGDAGECFLSTPDLAMLAQMSAGKCSQTRRELISMGFLAGEVRRDPGFTQSVWHLSIPDLWDKNAAWVKNYPGLKDRIAYISSLHQMKPSPDEKGTTPDEKGTTPDETNKIKEEDSKIKDNVDAWDYVCTQLKREMDLATYNDKVKHTEFMAFNDGEFHVRCYDSEWLAGRLSHRAGDLLSGLFGKPIQIVWTQQ